jgi:hypothetical protein
MRRTIIQLTDDIDGSAAVETIQFGIDGVDYTIDLNAKNAKRLRDALAKYTTSARKVRAAKTATPKRPESNAAEVREWAKSQGIEVNERGRVSADLRAQFSAALR